VNINDLFGSMPSSNLQTADSATSAKCLMNRSEHCVADKCMAWRWLRRNNAHVRVTDDDGVDVGVGWCGLAAWPDIGNAAD
jgi:hypothetical protein